ncbi:polysaccharide deacetylase family protein [Clostridium luticellarii]|jgi:peptidoglycan/xylan/chitin deacetylase (PgdA/CDA1 family)|uniref:Peptidoglycan-N-acetylmuramic acid deacetylase PdaC n=1 Tax=Clostridium luticellarii TaxID=1691940 RepID=A0A2T0BEY1_9CLOT|nr:polysaccharide deacetylase family protein [Clostridium luticellarii]MCI1944829.1 polysaccharide deacetylase [Clostridium luticellarii]MCI1968355.1 polysaccharide deacetylase [Clostridium luticellarii]MCI1995353.1 polysaccharide deacetylase [Clostridium luticellarii]MCI2039385.1 polysaccharide deacetylase [Clostridium luticellarii]PRR82377.1 Peptidoglycan-N-acetylmuramic acid deacetylase PdaC [Clostridium luticellarii]
MKIKYFILIILCILYIPLNCTASVKAYYTNSPFTWNNTDISPESRIIYLTFDDGPSSEVTNKILDVLKDKNVKATFFVIGSKVEGREKILKRIYREGHSIGLHTYTHKYNKIYSDDDSFLSEMDKTGEKVESILNFRPKIIRFPTGSKGHLDKVLLDKLHSSGYKVYDWNLCLSDGIDYKTPVDKLYREGTKKCINPNKIFLLAHCDSQNKNTCRVLAEIIDHYTNLGYEFKPISENTPEYHFRVTK